MVDFVEGDVIIEELARFSQSEEEEDEKGFFIRKLALRADVRLLLIGVNVTCTGGAGGFTALGAVGDVGDDLNDRLSPTH